VNNPSISGTVIYGTIPVNQSQRFVPGVLVSATGGSPASENTNSMGKYVLENLTLGGNYTVTPSKSGNINGSITPFDATLVLRCVAAGTNCTLTDNQKLAADTNNSATITPFDATQILRFVAANAQTNATGQVGNWKFNPISRPYASLNSSLSGENYEAILIGEVNGSWTPPASFAENPEANADMNRQDDEIATETTPFSQSNDGELSKQDGAQSEIQLSALTNAEETKGGFVIIPVWISNNSRKAISGYSFAVNYDPEVLQPITESLITIVTLSQSFQVISDSHKPGRLGIAASGGNNTTLETGTLLYLRFKVIGKLFDGGALNFNEVMFQDYEGNSLSIGVTR
jgi:hypothetical protein